MQDFKIKKSTLKGTITIPPSKSQTLRAILFGMMGKGKTTVHHYLNSPDTDAMVQACRQFGATIDVHPTHIEIEGGHLQKAGDVIQAGNSGIVLRFISGIAALCSHYVVISGDHSIRHKRPMRPLLEGLKQLGVFAVSTKGDGYAPVIIKGPIQSGKAIMSGEDSQPISAILIASVLTEEPIELEVHNPGETPWIDLTLDWFERLGIQYENHDYKKYRLLGEADYQGFEYTVPGDFSSAAFPIAAALITRSELTVKNVDFRDSQGDKEVIQLFKKMGAKLVFDQHELRIVKGGSLVGCTIDCNPFIDALPILAVLGCFAEGETKLINATNARHKECDRISTTVMELRKMGAHIEECKDGLVVRQSKLRGAQVDSHHDHRMAMALSVAALGADGESHICGVHCVNKTYSTFGKDLVSVGANIT